MDRRLVHWLEIYGWLTVVRFFSPCAWVKHLEVSLPSCHGPTLIVLIHINIPIRLFFVHAPRRKSKGLPFVLRDATAIPLVAFLPLWNWLPNKESDSPMHPTMRENGLLNMFILVVLKSLEQCIKWFPKSSMIETAKPLLALYSISLACGMKVLFAIYHISSPRHTTPSNGKNNDIHWYNDTRNTGRCMCPREAGCEA